MEIHNVGKDSKNELKLADFDLNKKICGLFLSENSHWNLKM